MKQKILIVMLLLTITATAQVGIQTSDPKATMDIVAQKGKVADGVLVPRLTADEVKEMTESSTTTGKKIISTDQNSLLVYVTATFTTTPTTNKEKYELITSKGFYYYDAGNSAKNGKWKKLQDSGSIYLPGPGITFTGTDTNEITASGLERVTGKRSDIDGLPVTTTQTNTGWRYIGMDAKNYGPTGKWATDLQHIPKSNDENKIAFQFIEAYPTTFSGYTSPAEIGEYTYTKVKNKINEAYGPGKTHPKAFDFKKVGAIGDHSLAGGVYNIAEGATGAVFGYGNRSTGLATIVSGRFNDVKGDMSFVMGENNTLDFSAKKSFIMGENNTSESSSSIIGKNNNLDGSAGDSFVVGEGNQIGAGSIIALGTKNKGNSGSANSILIGDQCSTNDRNSIVIGNLCKSNKSNSILIGGKNVSEVSGGMAIGSTNTVTHQNAILIGSNLTSSNNYQFVCGTKNAEDTGAAFILGGGSAGNLLVVKNATGQEGDLHTIGDIYAGGEGKPWKDVKAARFQRMSDIRLKKDIENLPVNSDILSQLRPVQYHWKEGDSNTLQYGFIAQEIEDIFPNLVSTDTQGEKYKSVNYDGFIPVLTKVLQEKSAEIASQKEEIASLKAQLQAEKERNDAQEARLKAIEAKLK